MKKLLSAALALIMALTLGCAALAYSDVSADKWYYENIKTMSDSGLLNGYEDGTFRPDSSVTYAEYISVLSRCTGSSGGTGSSGRTDISGGSGNGRHWAADDILSAYENGWYDYDEINESLYDKPVPRYMAVKLTALAANLPHNENDDGVYWRYMNEIKDFDKINGRYGYLVIRAYNNGVLTGDENGNFNPDSPVTRAEACAIISRAMKYADAAQREESGGESKNTASPEQTEAPSYISGGVSENGRLHVTGTHLSNERGEPVILQGMSSHGLQWFPEFISRAAIAKTAEAGANVFRLAMYTGEGGYLSDPEGMKARLYEGVENASAEDMYVIIDWHILSDGNPMTNAGEAEKFFDEVSRKYAGYDNVIYEICNEPNGGVTWADDVKPYAERIIPVIRKNSPDSVILVGSPDWSQAVNDAADNPLSFNNIMYTCHFYAGTHTQWLRDRITYALSKGAPIFVSEWGTSAADGNGGVFLDEARRWLDFLDENGISRVNWSLCDKDEASAAAAPGSGPDLTELSPSGRFVFESFKKAE